MKRWLIYLYERLPLPAALFLCIGISLSGLFLEKNSFSFLNFLLAFMGIFMFFCQQKLIDDSKDYAKDLIAHPKRPLSRGVVRHHEVLQAVQFLQICLFVFSLIIWVFVQQIAALAYVMVAAYLWVGNNDFFLKNWLTKRRLLRGILQQLAIFFVAIFAVSVGKPNAALAPSALSFGLILLGAFFTDDVCRNLNPKSHPVLASYIHYYGFIKAFECVIVALAVSAMGAIALRLDYLLIPCEGTVFVTLIVLFFQQDYYRIPQLAARISLFVHAWAVVIDKI